MKSVLVPVGRIAEFKKSVEKVNKKAIKYGCEQIQYDILGIIIESQVLPVFEGGEFLTEETRTRECYEVQISEPEIKVGDYKILGSIRHEIGIKTISGCVKISKEEIEKIDNTRCDHCGTKHHRKVQYVLESNVNGKILVIGGSCVQEYFGLHSKEVFGWSMKIEDFLDQMSEYGEGYWVQSVSLETALGLAIIEIEKNGFVPTGAMNVMTSADKIFDQLLSLGCRI